MMRLVTPRRFGSALLLVIAGTLAGCQTGGSADSGGGLNTETYATAYQNGQYQQAYSQAAAAAQSRTGAEADRAALIAGMSASALGRSADAVKWLTPLVERGDRSVAGRAAWTLGSMADSQGRTADAQKWYTLASQKDSTLSSQISGNQGDDAEANSATLATMQRTNDVRVAAASYSGKNSGSLCQTIKVVMPSGTSGQTNVGTTNVIDRGYSQSAPTMVGGRYTIQLAAFADQNRASKQLRQASSAANKAGVPSPQLVPTVDRSGKTLYAVRIGSYGSKDAAASDLQRLGMQGLVMAERN